MTPLHGDAAWRRLLFSIISGGEPVAPRGQPTREILHTNLIQIDMARPVVTSPVRRLSHRLMAAEALWVLNGSNELAPLIRFAKRYAEFSDDGLTLAGAYGPPIAAQLPYVVGALLHDRDTRQAVLTTWHRNPPPSKDIPCTVAMVFSVRGGRLHQHVFMRSSDAWLGVPYDMFTFACVGLYVACTYNAARAAELAPVLPGTLTISMTSSHLYERDLAGVQAVLASPAPGPTAPAPDAVVAAGDWGSIVGGLMALQEHLIAEGVWRPTAAEVVNG